MNGKVCPRLGEFAALAALKEVAESFQTGGIWKVSQNVRCEHPDAFPVETGRPISRTELCDLRALILEQVTPYYDRSQREFDLVLGLTLAEKLPFTASDLFHGETWNFLTLCVLPDLLCHRFPDLSRDRALSTSRRRNVLQRVWLRERLLGEVIHRPGVELKEDEFEQIVGRSSLARVPQLPRTMAEEMVRCWPSDRPEQLARIVGKLLVRHTGVIQLEALTPDDLRHLIRECAEAAATQCSQIS